MKTLKIEKIARPLLGLVGLLYLSSLSLAAHAVCNPNIPLSRPDTRYFVPSGSNPADNEVRDNVTGLIWQRCVLGMTWTGTNCTGAAKAVNWQDALELARTASPSNIAGASAWRLPNVVELMSLLDVACTNPALNAGLFPADPKDGVWTSSPITTSSGAAWTVRFNWGADHDSYKYDPHYVRLVRTRVNQTSVVNPSQ